MLTLSLRLLNIGRATLSAPLIASGPLESVTGMVDELAWDVALAGPVPPSLSREEFLRAAPTCPSKRFAPTPRG